LAVKFPYIRELYSFVDKDFIHDKEKHLSPDDLPDDVPTRYHNETEEEEFDFSLLKPHIEEAMKESSPPHSDFKLSASLHRILMENGLTRNIAAHSSLWHYMTVFKFENYVNWRFSGAVDGKRPEAKNRFLGGINRNALSRLWLWADLTFDEDESDPYHISKFSFNQNLHNFAVDTVLPRNRRLMRIIAKFVIVNDAKANTELGIKYLFPRMRILNATRKLYLLSDEEIFTYLDEFLDGMP